MRLDYTLYGLAVIFFIVAVVSLILVSDNTGKLLLTVSTAVIGLISVGTGFMLKPKVQTATSIPVPTVTQEAPAEQSQQATMEETPVDEPKIEAAPVVEVSVVDAVSQTETPSTEALVTTEVIAEATPTPTIPTTETSTDTSIDLTQVKGIGEKRATQLKANGISSIEDLAKADAIDLAAKLKVSPKIVEKWIAGAKEIIK